MTRTPNQQELEAFFQGKPVSTEFHAELSTRVEALFKGLEANTKDLARPGADSNPLAPKPNNQNDRG
jgi:hypothetical protein